MSTSYIINEKGDWRRRSSRKKIHGLLSLKFNMYTFAHDTNQPEQLTTLTAASSAGTRARYAPLTFESENKLKHAAKLSHLLSVRGNTNDIRRHV
jgi:hypothetical protein